MQKLLDIMQRLRDPVNGCPWDREQDFESIAPYTIEEAYEVADAIARRSDEDLQEELGDLLLQVVFHSQIAHEQDLFDFSDVVEGICEKMIRRHPHVFADTGILSTEEQSLQWDEFKAAERKSKKKKTQGSIMDSVPGNLPGLMRAQKLSSKAAKVGFDWPDIGDIFDKVAEEIKELQDAVSNIDKAGMKEELGDLLFAVCNIARHLQVDADAALRQTNQKFTQRFAYIERQLHKKGLPLQDVSLDDMETLWQDSKNQ
ncbi:MAG: nucleoside triphosphate pyrophosphohydrolase [Flavobacteriales bacterium]|nr:nucleoside triphosphate pyrophosphohydrolase [Flavobacteriales bacterium]